MKWGEGIFDVVRTQDDRTERGGDGPLSRRIRLGRSRSILGRPWTGHVVRAALFIVFVSYLYNTRFAPNREFPYEDAETVVRAANAGYPFHLLFPGSNGTPATLKRMSELDGDYGIQLIISVTGSAGRWWFGPSFQLRTQIAWLIVFMLYVSTAAVMLAPPVPLLVAVAGILSLLVLMVWGSLDFSPARFWGVAYAALIGSIYLGTALKPWSRARVIVLSLLAFLAAYAQFLRQEAAPTTYALGVALAGAAVITRLAVRRTSRPEMSAQASILTRRALAGGLLLILANAAVVPLERWCFAIAWRAPFSETAMTGHGVGWPMYLSLGYVSNPYNIGWRDPIGQVHAELIEPGLDSYFYTPEAQSILLREYCRIVISRPWLFIENVVARARRIHELAGEQSAATVPQTRPLMYAYWATPWVVLGSLMLLVWRGTVEGAVIWLCALALAAGASAGPLMVFPEYLGGLQGSIVALLLVVPGGIVGSLWENRTKTPADSQLARRILGGHGLMLLVAIAIVLIGIGVQAARYRDLQNAMLQMDPATAITAQEFRYAHVFNDQPVGKQGRVLGRLLASTEGSVARKVELAEGDLSLFRPEAVIRTASQIHVIAWMGRGLVPPVPRLFQGATHASLFICGNCAPQTSVNDIQTGLRWTMIGDMEWQGRYRMFSFPLSPTLRSAALFLVAAERTIQLDFTRPTALVPQLISRAQFGF
jgi:hypothetical protein